MHHIRKSIGAAILGLALAGALGFGATELYASAASAWATEGGSAICPVEKQASDSCPLEDTADCPKKTSSCPTDAKGA